MYYQDHLQTLQVAENKVFNWISEPCRPSWKSRNLMGFQHFKNSLRLSKVSVGNSNNQNSKSLVRKKKASLVKSVSRGLQHCPKSIFYSDHLKLDVPPTPPHPRQRLLYNSGLSPTSWVTLFLAFAYVGRVSQVKGFTTT